MSEKKQFMTFHNIQCAYLILRFPCPGLRGQEKRCNTHTVSLDRGTHANGKFLKYLFTDTVCSALFFLFLRGHWGPSVKSRGLDWASESLLDAVFVCLLVLFCDNLLSLVI